MDKRTPIVTWDFLIYLSNRFQRFRTISCDIVIFYSNNGIDFFGLKMRCPFNSKLKDTLEFHESDSKEGQPVHKIELKKVKKITLDEHNNIASIYHEEGIVTKTIIKFTE